MLINYYFEIKVIFRICLQYVELLILMFFLCQQLMTWFKQMNMKIKVAFTAYSWTNLHFTYLGTYRKGRLPFYQTYPAGMPSAVIQYNVQNRMEQSKQDFALLSWASQVNIPGFKPTTSKDTDFQLYKAIDQTDIKVQSVTSHR